MRIEFAFAIAVLFVFFALYLVYWDAKIQEAEANCVEAGGYPIYDGSSYNSCIDVNVLIEP